MTLRARFKVIFLRGRVGRVIPLRAARLQQNGAQRTDAPYLSILFLKWALSSRVVAKRNFGSGAANVKRAKARISDRGSATRGPFALSNAERSISAEN